MPNTGFSPEFTRTAPLTLKISAEFTFSLIHLRVFGTALSGHNPTNRFGSIAFTLASIAKCQPVVSAVTLPSTR